VQRQSLPVVEAGTTVSVLSVDPSSGSGDAARFTFLVDDEAGYENVAGAFFTFSDIPVLNTPPRCDIGIDVALNQVSLFGFIGGSFEYVGDFQFGSAGSKLSSDQCTVYSDGSTMSGAGNQLTIALQVGFAPSFAGRHRIVAHAQEVNNNTTPDIILGNWTVPQGSRQPRRRASE